MTLRSTDLARAYDLSIPHPDIPTRIENMGAKATAFRSDNPPSFSPVGSLGRPIDIFVPNGRMRGAVAMIHGGYWVRGAPTDITHLAAGALKQGVAVGFVPYGLCPRYTIGDAISHAIEATRIVSETAGVPAAVFGHSAGGHLAAAVVAAGVSSDAVFVSGLYDLTPIVRIPLNETLALTVDTARAWSPSERPPLGPASVFAVVGENEPRGFLDQQEVLVEAWNGDAEIRSGVLVDGDHFSEIATLTDPESPLTVAVVEAALAAAARHTSPAEPGA